jgi:predicted anti-sigma-YlaC factor YlaD
MTEPMRTLNPACGSIHDKLGAYLDGELDRRAQSEVQAHLATCSTCQAELEELRRLSHLLKAAPQPDLTPALTFKAQLMLQLPHRAEPQHPRLNARLLPWMALALPLVAWIFIQVTLGLSTLVSLANQAGLLDGAAAWAATGPQQNLGFVIAQAVIGGLLGQQGLAGLNILNNASLFAQNLIVPFLWQVGVALLYWGALALVWHTKVKALWTSLDAGHA